MRWWCTSCGDEGVVSGWEDSPFDLRPRRPFALAAERSPVVVSLDVAATLRDVTFLDIECERLVFGAKADSRGVVLTCDAQSLEELMGCVAAEANHEQDHRRQKRLDDAFGALDKGGKTLR